MHAPRALVLLCTVGLSSILLGCPDDPYHPPDDSGVDGGTGSDGGDGGTTPDTGPRDTGEMNGTCNNPAIPAPTSGSCNTTAGTNGAILIRGNLVMPEGLLENAHLLINNGRIACAGCDCSADPVFANATKVECAQGLISPGLINAHDHITFTETPPTPPSDPNERYDHRHQWRRGQDGHERIGSVSNQGGNSGTWWGELRHLMSGATSINGSGAAAGLLRNLDRNNLEGLSITPVHYETFPLGDSGGERLTTGCAYPEIDNPTSPAITNAAAYTPHIAEGIDLSARNEWQCLAMGDPGMSLVGPKTGVIHGVGLLASDFALMASRGASLIWSPRSNIDLYGNTAQVVLAANSGVKIALGTDWTASGSMNVVRELVCADELNKRNFGSFFTDRQILDMSTANAAASLGVDGELGALKVGYFADIAIYDGSVHRGYRAVLDSKPNDVVLVLRGGRPMYGDFTVMSALPDTATGCELIPDVCGREKSVCSQRDTGLTIAEHRAAIASNAYDLFFCDLPPMEPTCVPYRTGEYMGIPGGADADGDGIIDAMDNCPNVFNPVRPMDTDRLQANADGDDLGDACDVCPTDPGTATCTPPDPNDTDKDGVPNASDNCPDTANELQENMDQDQFGDACDLCPNESNLGGALCTATVYQVKQATVSAGSQVHLANLYVTAIAPNGYYVQVLPGDATFTTADFSGIFVFAGAAGMKPARGDRIDLDATTGAFMGQTQLSNGTFTVLSSNNPEPAPVTVTGADVATGGARAAALEAVLIQVDNVTVTDVAPAPGMNDTPPTNEFAVTGNLRVNDQMYLVSPFPVLNQPIAYVRGVLRFANANHKLEPRDSADVGVPEALVAIVPGTVLVPVGTNGIPAGGLKVTITRPASMPIPVTLSSSDPGVTVPAMVTVATGSTSANITVAAPADVANPVTLTATYDGRMVQGTLRVYSDASPRGIASFTLDRTIIGINSDTDGQLTLDLPAASSGTLVRFSVNPPAMATVVDTATIAAGERQTFITLTTNSMTGNATIEARVGANVLSLPFQVTASVQRPPMPGDLVITEVHRNPSASSEKFLEWFEVYNSSGDVIEINGIVVADNSAMATLNAPGATIEPGTYAVIAYSTDLATNGGVDAIADYGDGDLQLANSDDLLSISYMGTMLDVVDWAGTWPGGGQGVSMCLKFPYAADNNVAGSWANSAVTTIGTTPDRGSPNLASDATNCP